MRSELSGGECSIDGCGRRAKYLKTGWCQTHYHRWWRTGDPLAVKQERGAKGADCVSWRGEDVTYHAVHTRVRTLRGRASDYSCVLCGGAAAEWAYDHTDPSPRLQVLPAWGGAEMTVEYSVDESRYEPRCRACHIYGDRSRKGGWVRKTHCRNGHQYDGENTYIHPRDGSQTCRRCAKERARRKREALRSQGLSSRGTKLRPQRVLKSTL